MEEPNIKVWKNEYTWVLLLNVVYVLLFLIIMKIYS